jgi:signal transduction histidine kinase
VRLKIQKAPFERNHDGMRPVLCAELLQNAAHVRLHGVLADGEAGRNHLVGVAGRNSLENLDLAALLLRFHAAAQDVSTDGGARQKLDEALKVADRILIEARDKVSRLRADGPPRTDIAARFKAIGEDLNYEKNIQYNVTVHGKTAELDPAVLDEVYFIGREALTNAFRHADASVIAVSIAYAWTGVTFIFSDNGCGFHPEASRMNLGHWGISGMMERAHRIGAKFECQSVPGTGTSISISVRGPRFGARAAMVRIARIFRR